MNKVFGKKILWTATALWAASAVSAAAFEPDPFGREPDKAKPYAELEPSYNITSFMDAKPQPAAGIEKETDDIYFSADEMIDNKDMQTITAVGDVNIIRKDQTLKADKVIYNQKDDIVTAVGNVSIVQADGTVVFSDYVELDDKMTKGHMTDVRIIMKDETRIAASKFRKMANDNKVMENVVYSPCDVCRSKDPLWQIKARKVKHDAKNQDVYYNDAFIEVKGVPVFYTPFLSHPDPSVKRRSGFIAPTIGSSSYLGGYFQPRYFWNISDHEDLLFAPMLSSDKGIVWNGEYRKYFYKGDIEAQGSFLTDEDKDKNRGNLFLKARYEINDFWLADTDINYASDSLYLKDLSLPYKDNAWLTSRIRLQGFDNRNYASAEAYYYKLVSYNLREADKNEFNRRNLNKPFVAPLISYENISDVGTYGAYTKTNLDFASVYREDDVSTQRASMINSWVLPYTSPYGEKYRMVASVKSDLYYVDNYTNEDDQNFTGGVARVFPRSVWNGACLLSAQPKPPVRFWNRSLSPSPRRTAATKPIKFPTKTVRILNFPILTSSTSTVIPVTTAMTRAAVSATASTGAPMATFSAALQPLSPKVTNSTKTKALHRASTKTATLPTTSAVFTPHRPIIWI